MMYQSASDHSHLAQRMIRNTLVLLFSNQNNFKVMLVKHATCLHNIECSSIALNVSASVIIVDMFPLASRTKVRLCEKKIKKKRAVPLTFL